VHVCTKTGAPVARLAPDVPLIPPASLPSLVSRAQTTPNFRLVPYGMYRAKGLRSTLKNSIFGID